MSESCWKIRTFSDFSTFSTFKYALLHVKCATNARIVWGMTTQRAPVGANNRYPAPCKSLWGWPESDCSWSHLEVGGRKGFQGWNRLSCSGLRGLTASCQDGEYVFDSFLPAAQTFQHFLPQWIQKDWCVGKNEPPDESEPILRSSVSKWMISNDGALSLWKSTLMDMEKTFFKCICAKSTNSRILVKLCTVFFSIQILLNSF